MKNETTEEKSAAEKAARRDAAKAYDARVDLKVGDVLHGSWGYDQTNCEFYQIIGLTAKTATIRALATEQVEGGGSAMSEMLIPKVGELCGREIKARVHKGGTMAVGHAYCSKWDGRPKYNSWYA